MWKRNTKAPRLRVYEGLMHSESYYDDPDDPKNWMGGSGSSYTEPQIYDESRAPTRPQRKESLRPGAMLKSAFEPLKLETYQDSVFRPASSIYSHPSPNPISTRFPPDAYQAQGSYQTEYEEEEASPQSSPELRAQNHRYQLQLADDGQISPAIDMPDISQLDYTTAGLRLNPPSRTMPSSRKENWHQVTTAAANLVGRKQAGDGPKVRIAHDPRWDPYSGEITTSDRGKPQSVKPGTFTPSSLQSTGVDTHVTDSPPKQYTSFGDRLRKLKINSSAPAERPEWKGASGRIAIAPPVQDHTHMSPLSVPRKSSKAPTNRTVGGRKIFEKPSTASPVRITPEVSPPAIRNLAGDEDDASSEREREDTLARLDRNYSAQRHLRGIPQKEDKPYVQPDSRFSVTTYAPSEAPNSDSRESTGHPFPTPDLNPLVNRTHPRYAEPSRCPSMTGSVISRKAVGGGDALSPLSSVPAHIMAEKPPSSNVAKDLPMSPAEAESRDLITSLQAQLDDLAHRRANITKGIRQMTQLMPKDSVMLAEDVRRKREAEKRKVARLTLEEADIKREEHELGLKLHRAWKRQDKASEFESTGLWVRRVTGDA